MQVLKYLNKIIKYFVTLLHKKLFGFQIKYAYRLH